MKHARPDYNRIQDPAGLIPENEPVFLLRGQDACAPAAVRAWARAAQSIGAEKNIIQAALDQAEAMEEYMTNNGVKVPDMP